MIESPPQAQPPSRINKVAIAVAGAIGLGAAAQLSSLPAASITVCELRVCDTAWESNATLETEWLRACGLALEAQAEGRGVHGARLVAAHP